MPKFTFTRTDTFFVEIESDTLEDAQLAADTTSIFELADNDIVQGDWILYSFNVNDGKDN